MRYDIQCEHRNLRRTTPDKSPVHCSTDDTTFVQATLEGQSYYTITCLW